MAKYTLKAQERTVTGKKVRRLRNEGLVPIVIYGPTQEPKSLQVAYRELEVTLAKAGGTNLVDIEVEGGETFSGLARDVQRDMIRGTILHVDFLAIDPKSKVIIDVPVYYNNQSAAVVARKGILLTGPNALRLEMRAANMRDRIDIDLSEFGKVGDSLYVKDLDFADGTRVLNDPEQMVLRIAQSSAARREEALAKVAGGGEGEATENE